MKSTIRAFIAIEISHDVSARAKRAIQPLRDAFPDVKWIEEDAFHLTLKFLGANVPTNEIHQIVAATQKACNDVEPFDLVFESLGAFPEIGNPRTLWIGVSEGTQQLCKLARRIDEELALLGYPQDWREFSPHITIGRTRLKDRGATGRMQRNKRVSQPAVDNSDESDSTNYVSLSRLISERANLSFGTTSVDCVILYSSELDRAGASYDELAEIPLAPIGSERKKNAPFQPNMYDDPDAVVDQDDIDVRLTSQIDATLDVAALDAEVEDELRAICGDAFVDNPFKDEEKTVHRKKTSRTPKSKSSPPTSKRALPEPEELDDFDLAEFEKTMAQETGKGDQGRFSKRCGK